MNLVHFAVAIFALMFALTALVLLGAGWLAR